ncbi:MAG: acyl-CoA dehydrogenase family protein, partial [Proteobacteria bacterium]|nr:acyl-CoA dehydrogenase family protein [Pseudomonadota bacterium]
MDWNTTSDADFRAEVRGFVESQFPPALRNHPRRIPRWETTRDWFLTLSAKGWIAPNWPAAHGGMGLAAS